MALKSADKRFEQYFESTFQQVNILTKKEYENACESYESAYGEILPNNRAIRILDVGCGAGQFLYYLRKAGYTNFLGIDISPQQVEFCLKNISDKVKVADMFEFLKDAKETYGVIVAHDVVEHIAKERIPTFLDMVYSSLYKGGIFIMRVPNMSNPLSLDSRYRDFTHEIGFTEKTLYQILWIAGFRDIQISSSSIVIHSFRNRVRHVLVVLVQRAIRFLYYIQDFSVPQQLGKNLIAVCRK